MSQTFRKYLSNRGSALFMVLSTMSALLLLVTAMYFSVVSSREVQYAVFNQEQSYQSSISISDALVASLRAGKATELSNEIMKLSPPASGSTTGGVLSTNGNGFAEFLGETNGTYSTDQLGAYTVDVTRLSDATENGTLYQVYDFAITTSVGGVLETTHTFVRMSGEFTDPPDIFGTGMTATGYVPNTPRLYRGTYNSPMRYDSEFCLIGGDDAAGWTVFKSDLTCTGTAKVTGVNPNNGGATSPLTWCFGNDLILAPADNGEWTPAFSLQMNGTDAKRGRAIIGGNLIAERGQLVIPANTDVFVKGDCIVPKSGISLANGAGLYIGGNLIHDPDDKGWGYQGMSAVNANIYLGGNFIDVNTDAVLEKKNLNDKLKTLDTSEEKWVDAFKYLTEKVTSPSYEKWEVVGEDNDTANHVTLYFNNSDKTQTKGTVFRAALTMTNDDLVFETYKTGDHEATVVIDDIIDLAEWCNDNGALAEGTSAVLPHNVYTYIIDTGDDPKNVFKIRAEPNHDYDMDDTPETFTWLPLDDLKYKSDAGKRVNVLYKGRGSVVVEVPSGSTYQAAHMESIMHYNWYAMLGGSKSTNASAQVEYTTPDQLNSGSYIVNEGWVHSIEKCKDSVKCDIKQKPEAGKDKILGTEDDVMTHYCDTHKRKVTSSEISNDCGCYGYVEKTVVQKVAEDNMATYNSKGVGDGFYDANGFVCPTVNWLVVSNDESAQIRLSAFDDGMNVSQNTFWGWIYAPYMTYMAKPVGEGSGGTRIVGGIIVADYVTDDWYAFTYVRPDQELGELVNNLQKNGQFAGFTWKTYGY